MDILYREGRATAGQVRDRLPGSTSDSTVRTQLRVMEEKGHIRHEEEGLRYVYLPTAPRGTVRKSALRHLVDTFSTVQLRGVTTLLGDPSKLSDAELDRIAALVEKARKAGER